MWRRPPPSPLFQTRYPAPALVPPPPSRFSSSTKRKMKSQTSIQNFCNYPDFFQWSSLEPEALLSLSSVLLTNCSILQVHVQNFQRTSIKNHQQLDLRPRPSILSSPMPSLNVEGTVGQVGQDGQLGHSKDDAEKELSYSSYYHKVDGLVLIFLRIHLHFTIYILPLSSLTFLNHPCRTDI